MVVIAAISFVALFAAWVVVPTILKRRHISVDESKGED
jgi:hypothetical protein